MGAGGASGSNSTGGIEKAVQRGRQAYIVYPLVEESEKLEEIQAATEMAERLQCEVFPHLRLGLLHGRMRSLREAGSDGSIQSQANRHPSFYDGD